MEEVLEQGVPEQKEAPAQEAGVHLPQAAETGTVRVPEQEEAITPGLLPARDAVPAGAEADPVLILERLPLAESC